jgi:hypothetical protein
VARKVLVGPQFFKYLTQMTPPPEPGDDYIPGEGISDPDGNRVYTEVGYPPPAPPASPIPVSGMKGATVVTVGSILVTGSADIVLGLVTPGAHQFFWPTVFTVTASRRAYGSIGGSRGATNDYVLHIDTAGGGGSVTVFYKVYKIDES